MTNTDIEYDTPSLDTSYDFVAIIDGLSASDRIRFEISNKINALLTQESLPTRLTEVGTKSEFIAELGQLLTLAESGKKFLIHIVAHGDEKGIAAGNDDVDWPDMVSGLQAINKATGNSLILNMSTCKGLYGARTVPCEGEYPFFGLIGAKTDLAVSDALKANEIMYRKWLNDVPVQEMVPETNSELGKEVLFNLSAEGFRKLTSSACNNA
ncbi:TPA: hypothetical protein I7229_22010 [Vibrio vulnificus]|nr:hypothetical protein [Vibrio vulnificus]HDY7572094.1 hypothetical protein [Vibrio vulnificus]